MPSLASISLTRAGSDAAGKLATALPGLERHVPVRFAGMGGRESVHPFDEPVRAVVTRLFSRTDGLVLFMALGAAVRLLAPLLRDKQHDPAVVVVDETCRFAISLVSGHVGGANELARQVAAALGAEPVITTASDVRGLPALDRLGSDGGWRCETDAVAMKQAAAALLDGGTVAIYQDAGDAAWQQAIPAEQRRVYDDLHAFAAAAWPPGDAADGEHSAQAPDDSGAGVSAALAIVVTDRDVMALISDLAIPTVVYHPPTLVAGVGCTRGAPAEEIDLLLKRALAEVGRHPLALAALATIDLKRDEAGINAVAAQFGVPVTHFSAEQLAEVAAPHPSAVVAAAVGTPGVCEPAALLAGGGPLLVEKRRSARVTVAIARVGTAGQYAVSHGLHRRGPWGATPLREPHPVLATPSGPHSARPVLPPDQPVRNGPAERSVVAQPTAPIDAPVRRDGKDSGDTPSAGSDAALSFDVGRPASGHVPATSAPMPSGGRGRLSVVGIGPGGYADLTHRAAETLRQAERIVGYHGYTAAVKNWLPDATYVESPIGDEVGRCTTALELAQQGMSVALVCSGDAGIYALAGLVHEVAWQRGWRFQNDPAEIVAVPGVTAAVAAAALVGAPLANDFATVSLSDLLTPWSVIEQRLAGAAVGDFVVALYNPMSARRTTQFPRACAILLEHRAPTTPVAIVRQVGRPDQEPRLTTLATLARTPVDMLTVIIVGNSTTMMIGGRIVTPRGYPTMKSQET